MRPFLPMVFLQRRLLLILPLGALASLMLVLLIPHETAPIFETNAIILIDPRKETTIGGRERDVIPGSFREYSLTLVSRMSNPDVMRGALERLPSDQYPSFLDSDADADHNARRLLSRFNASEMRRTHLIGASLSGPDPTHLGATLNAVVEEFIDRMQTEQEGLYARRISYLTEERDRLEHRIEEMRNQLLAMASDIESAGFLHEHYTLHLYRIDVIDRLYWAAEADASEKRGLLQKAQADREALSALDQQALADERVMTSWALNNIEHWTYTQLQSMRGTIDGLTPENEDRRYVEERMTAMEEYRTAFKERIIRDTIENMDAIRLYNLEEDVLRAQSAYNAARRSADQLAAALETAREEANVVSTAIFRGTDIAFNIGQLRERLAAINGRIDDAEIEAKAPIRVSLEQRAVDPARPARATGRKVVAFALLLGFGGVFGFVLTVDILDNRIRAPRELELALGAPGPDPITAHTSCLSPAPVFERASVDTLDHPAIPALRDLAVRINIEYERENGRIFVLLGLNNHCGSTSLALNLAHSLTAFRERVLLLETNMRRPGMRAALEWPPAKGLETVLRGEGEWADSIRHDPARGVDVLFAEGGEQHANLQRLGAILDELRETYDIVLVDAGNVTADPDAYHVGARADAAIVIARADVSYYRDLRRAIDAMVQAGVPALTAVLTFANPLFMTRFMDRLQQPLMWLTRIHKRVRKGLERIPLLRFPRRRS